MATDAALDAWTAWQRMFDPPGIRQLSAEELCAVIEALDKIHDEQGGLHTPAFWGLKHAFDREEARRVEEGRVVVYDWHRERGRVPSGLDR